MSHKSDEEWFEGKPQELSEIVTRENFIEYTTLMYDFVVKGITKKRECLWCGRYFIVPNDMGNGAYRFCDIACRDDFRRELAKVKNKNSEGCNGFAKLRWEVLLRDGFRCQYCGRTPTRHRGIALHVDHIKPRSKGGKDVMENLITSCDDCNMGKGSRDHSEKILCFFGEKNFRSNMKKARGKNFRKKTRAIKRSL